MVQPDTPAARLRRSLHSLIHRQQPGEDVRGNPHLFIRQNAVFAGRGRRAGLDCDAEALWLRGTEARAQPAERVAHPDKECGNKEKVGHARRQPLNCTRGG